MAIEIRAATPADLPALGRLGALLVRAHHDFDAKRFIPATSETEAGYSWFLGTQLEKPNVAVLVADDDGEVVGYSYAGVEGRDYMSLRGPAGILYDVVVDPSRRNHGVGRQLVEAALGFLKNHGSTQVVLSTATHNDAAQHLFESVGFRRTMVEMTTELTD
jgi:ribosomal protein S18 acetylase RimI-like enzyme